jgi:segregation and condensation protein A
MTEDIRCDAPADFEPAVPEYRAAEPVATASQLVLNLDGFEGPIDVLLALARDQKVDLTKISILELAEQYLVFVNEARRLRLELAADYLVMAAWLAYLKSRLLLPADAADEEPSGEEMAAALAFQLQRLEAIREAGEALFARALLGRDVFARGAPEGVRVVTRSVYEASLYELLQAYGAIQRRGKAEPLRIEQMELFTMDEALERLERALGALPDWSTLMSFLPEGLRGLKRRSAIAATFLASLELARSGRMQLRQDGRFGTIYIRRNPDQVAVSPTGADIVPLTEEGA